MYSICHRITQEKSHSTSCTAKPRQMAPSSCNFLISSLLMSSSVLSISSVCSPSSGPAHFVDPGVRLMTGSIAGSVRLGPPDGGLASSNMPLMLYCSSFMMSAVLNMGPGHSKRQSVRIQQRKKSCLKSSGCIWYVEAVRGSTRGLLHMNTPEGTLAAAMTSSTSSRLRCDTHSPITCAAT